MEPLSPDAINTLREAKERLIEHSIDRISADLPWFRELPRADRERIETVARAGVSTFIDWIAGQVDTGAPMRIFSAAPQTFTGVISLDQTIALVRIVVDTVQAEAPTIVPPQMRDAVRLAVAQFGSDVGFATAGVYARAAEVRGAWDARLESVAVDALLHDDASVAMTRVSAAGWRCHGPAVAISAQATLDAVAVSRLRHEAHNAAYDCLISVHSENVLILLGSEGDWQDKQVHERLGKAATELAKTLEGDAVIGPVVADISEGSYSLRCAMAGLDALPAWPGAPRPVQANDLLPERVFAGDELAKAQLFEQIYKPLHALGSTIEETIYTYLLSGASLEGTARALFVHTNTVRYRLGRVASQLGWDATDPREAFVLHTAIILGRLAQSAKTEQ